MVDRSTLLHVTNVEGWAAAQAAGTLGAAPFLHLCTVEQLAFVLERHFSGQIGLLVLEIETPGLDVRWEVSEPGMPPFPHLYGFVPIELVHPLDQTGAASTIR